MNSAHEFSGPVSTLDTGVSSEDLMWIRGLRVATKGVIGVITGGLGALIGTIPYVFNNNDKKTTRIMKALDERVDSTEFKSRKELYDKEKPYEWMSTINSLGKYSKEIQESPGAVSIAPGDYHYIACSAGSIDSRSRSANYRLSTGI